MLLPALEIFGDLAQFGFTAFIFLAQGCSISMKNFENEAVRVAFWFLVPKCI